METDNDVIRRGLGYEFYEALAFLERWMTANHSSFPARGYSNQELLELASMQRGT
jgi:ABC-type oligopeptide transport system substrate-binding subunit